MDQLIEPEARTQLVGQVRDQARRLREKGPEPVGPPTDDDSVRSAARTDNPLPTPPWWGVREVPVDLDEVFAHLDTHVLFKLHWGGRGVKGEAWRKLIEEDFRPRLERMWAEGAGDWIRPGALLGYLPANSDGNELVIFDPTDHDREIERFVFPRQPGHDRICLADFYRPLASGERDVCALQAVTAGAEVTRLVGRLEAEGEFAEQLFVHGLGVQAAEGMAEWLHAVTRRELGIPATQGRRYSWGYPACPEQSEHGKVDRLLRLAEIGISVSDGFALEPEQSTVAIVAHHPQAVYFGMKSGRLRAQGAPDDVIAGSDRDPSRGAPVSDEGEPELAGAAEE
jgi:5-methyltetrahydrofolate--homocysteine methyltransferase